MCTVKTVINKTSLHTEIFGVFLDILAMYTNVTKEDDICSFIELQSYFTMHLYVKTSCYIP